MTTTTLKRNPVILRQILAAGAARFDDTSDPVQTLAWFAEQLGPKRIGVAASFSDTVLSALASRAIPGVDVLFVDTGYHFAETLGTRDAVAATYDVNVRTLLPLATVEQQNAEHGPELFARNPDQCCALRKTAPMEAGLADYDAWVSGLRRADHPGRANAHLLEWDQRRDMIKLNPLVAFTDEQIEACVREYGLLENPLSSIGYKSIGCAPCTRPVAEGEDARAGRWTGSTKTECGLHL